MLTKIPYYLKSGLKILIGLKNPWIIIGLLLNKKPVLIFRNGLNFKIFDSLDILIIKETIYDDVYQLSTLDLPKKIVDIGGGIGDFSIYAAKIFPNAQILSFEPNKKLVNLFNENILLNKIKNIRLKEKAIGSKKNKYLFVNNSLLTQGTFYPESVFSKKENNFNKFEIKIETLNKYVNSLVDLLKIDCEGAEWEIIRSINTAKLKLVKNIAIEYHDYIVPGINKKILQYLTSQNFVCEIKQDKYNSKIGYIYAKNNNYFLHKKIRRSQGI